jgi:hypothetical protein
MNSKRNKANKHHKETDSRFGQRKSIAWIRKSATNRDSERNPEMLKMKTSRGASHRDMQYI